MQLVNKSNWDLSGIRSIAFEVARREKSLSTTGRMTLKITVGRSKVNRYSGYATYGTKDNPGKVTLRLPVAGDTLLPNRIAATLSFLIGVAAGLRRKDMKGLSKYNTIDQYIISNQHGWAAEFPVKLKLQAPKKEPKPEVVRERKVTARDKELAKCYEMVKRYEDAIKKCNRVIQLSSRAMVRWARKANNIQLKIAEEKMAEQTKLLETKSVLFTGGRKFRDE